jgi:hypothetical protein
MAALSHEAILIIVRTSSLNLKKENSLRIKILNAYNMLLQVANDYDAAAAATTAKTTAAAATAAAAATTIRSSGGGRRYVRRSSTAPTIPSRSTRGQSPPAAAATAAASRIEHGRPRNRRRRAKTSRPARIRI